MCASVLGQVVALGGLALQAEDCTIRGATAQRGQHGGLARIENERFHQFVIWRAILPLWDAILERESSSDIIISCAGDKHYIEMKNWRGASGGSQLPAMRKDIDKLRGRDKAYFVVTSMNPASITDENYDYLMKQVPGLDRAGQAQFHFATVGLSGEPLEFWIAGWPLDRPLATAATTEVAPPL